MLPDALTNNLLVLPQVKMRANDNPSQLTTGLRREKIDGGEDDAIVPSNYPGLPSFLS